METARLLGIIVLLAAIDTAGTLALKEASVRRDPMLALTGVCMFVVLAGVLYMALEVSELTLVSLGWIVAVQTAVMLADWRWYNFRPGPLQVTAICVAMVALIVAAVAPAPTPADPPRTGRHIAPDTSGAGDAVPPPRSAVEDRRVEQLERHGDAL